jgi:hypothetical protein
MMHFPRTLVVTSQKSAADPLTAGRRPATMISLQSPSLTRELAMRLCNVNIVSEHGLFFRIVISNGGGW